MVGLFGMIRCKGASSTVDADRGPVPVVVPHTNRVIASHTTGPTDQVRDAVDGLNRLFTVALHRPERIVGRVSGRLNLIA